MVVVAMTSNPIEVDYSFTITSSDLVQGQLNRSGKVRVDKIYTLSQSIVVKKLGQVDSKTLDKIRSLLQSLTAYSTI